MPRSVPALFVLIALAGPGPAASEDSRARRYELPDFDALELTLPAGWRDTVVEQPGSAEVTIEFAPELGGSFEAYVTPDWNPRAPGRILDAEALRALVRENAARLPATDGAEPPEIRRLQGADGVGYYFIATGAPAAEDWPHLVQGAIQAGGLVLRFEILTQSADDPAVALALAMLQGAVHRDRGNDRP